MAGLFRFFLAMNVVVFHLVPSAFVGHWGIFAVFSFYVLSGYLITLILHRSYGFTLRDGWRFALNRVLRLFPAYYCVCLLGLVLLLFYGAAVTAFHPAIRMPSTTSAVAGNLLIVPFLWDGGVRLAPPTWSLAVELVCYGLLWLWIARNRTLALLTAFAALGYTIYVVATGGDLGARYFTLTPSVLPFTLGCCTYFYQDAIRACCGPKTRVVALMLFAVNLWGAPRLFSDVTLWPFYLNLPLTCLVVLFATDIRPANRSLRWLDDWAARLTYPVFLAHWQIAFLSGQLFLGESVRSWRLCFVSLPLLLLFSAAISHFVERRLERLRDRVRPVAGIVPLPAVARRRAA